MSNLNGVETFRKTADAYIAEYSGKYTLNYEGYKKMLYLCELFDLMAEELSAEAFALRMTPEERFSGTMTFEVDDLILLNGRKHTFFDSVKCADRLKFSKSKSEALQIEFTVNDLWVKK
jgi:hypothetical protein